MKCSKMLIGIGNMMVELCSAEILLRVCRYRSCKMFVDQSTRHQSCHPHLQGRGTLGYHLGCLSQSFARLLLTLSCDHLILRILVRIIPWRKMVTCLTV